MILTCPECGTQYVVKDGAIPPEGRQVRCAACKHSWHQEPESAPDAETQSESLADAETHAHESPAKESEAAPSPKEDEGLAEATLIDPRSGPEAEERAYEEAVIEGEAEPAPVASGVIAPTAEHSTEAASTVPAGEDWKEPPHAESEADDFNPFPEDGDAEPRKRSTLTTIMIIALVIIIGAALFWFFAPPDLKARLGIAAAGASPLALVTTHLDRQRLESGQEFLTVTGRVINPTAKEQEVPPLQAQLRSHSGKIVYSWTIAPPARSLAAGASASFNSAEVNVPPGGEELTITLGQPKA